MKIIIAAALVALASAAASHEMSPTYPILKPSYVDGVKTTEMVIINKREDIDYYSVNVFDKDWNPIKFVSDYPGVLRVPYMGKRVFKIYIRNKDANRAEYICTKSKALKNDPRTTSVTSRICSRVSN